MAFRDVEKLWRKRNEKLPPKAERKKPGEGVVVVPSKYGISSADWSMLVKKAALDRVAQRINQPTRDLYDGKIEVTEDPEGQTVRFAVCLTDLKTGEQLGGNVSVDYEYVGVEHRGLIAGHSLGDLLVQELLDRHPGCRNPLPKRLPDLDSLGMPSSELPPDVEPEKPKKPKKVCPICGPESDDYPEWNTECGHDY